MNLAARIQADLKARYAEPHRVYHTWAHLEQMGGYAQMLTLDQRDDVVAAILFHDAIYDPKASDNEIQSVHLMRDLLKGSVASDVLDRAEMLILATVDHEVPKKASPEMTRICGLFIDMDLAILAAYEPEFLAYDAAIRKEYAHVPDAKYRKGRIKAIETFLARPNIFLSEPFSGMEFSARHNLQAALTRLAKEAEPDTAPGQEPLTPNVATP